MNGFKYCSDPTSVKLGAQKLRRCRVIREATHWPHVFRLLKRMTEWRPPDVAGFRKNRFISILTIKNGAFRSKMAANCLKCCVWKASRQGCRGSLSSESAKITAI